MYALERWVFLKTGHCPRYCWQRYAVSANRLLLDKVRRGQPNLREWRIVSMAFSLQDERHNFAQSA